MSQLLMKIMSLLRDSHCQYSFLNQCNVGSPDKSHIAAEFVEGEATEICVGKHCSVFHTFYWYHSLADTATCNETFGALQSIEKSV